MSQLLLAGTRLEVHGGSFRGVQNWIGGSDYNPCSADFVPPPPELVAHLMDDLCAFCNTDDLPPVAQAAIAHAQFETIHPFVDGNGRTGRAIVHLVLRRRGLVPRVLPPVSLVLATLARDYVKGLTATRYVGSPSSPEASTGVNRWGCHLCRRLHQVGRRCQCLRGARRRPRAAMARAVGPGARQLGNRRAPETARRCPGAHGRKRSDSGRPHIQPGQ